MSFLRPELEDRIRRWREALVWGAVGAAGLWLAGAGLLGGGLLRLGLGLAVGAVAAGLMIAAIRRTRLMGMRAAEGVVTLDEGRIGYFAPQGGGFVDLPTLDHVEITRRATPWGTRSEWHLAPRGGPPLTIPLGARDAALVFDAIAQLPGIDTRAVLQAASGRGGLRRVRVWSHPDPTIGRVATGSRAS